MLLTDIFGNSIKNDNLTFFLINKVDLNKNTFVKKLIENNEIIIYDYNIENIKSLQNVNKNNSENIVYFGNAIYKINTNSSKKISLLYGQVDNNIIKKAVDFKLVSAFQDGHIWLPIGPQGYGYIGLIYKKGQNKPDIKNIGVVKNDYIIQCKQNNSAITFNNDFNLLHHSSINCYTLNKTKLAFLNNDTFKLISSENGKKLTNYNNSLTTKSSQSSQLYNQDIQYSVQGDLMMGDDCITSNEEGHVYLDTCNGTLDQKWFPYMNNFISKKTKKCLSVNKQNEVITKQCDNEDSLEQEWTMEISDDFENKPIKAIGKNIILVDSDDPWYENKELSIVQPNIIKTNFDAINGYTENSALFKTDFKMDPHKKNLGYGYSFADRQGVPCNIEHFNEENKTNYNSLILPLILVIILLFFKYYLSKK
jgi:hypothetical protein